MLLILVLQVFAISAFGEDFDDLNVTGAEYVKELTNLEKTLLKGYSKNTRPVKSPEFKITITFFPQINHIQQLDEKQGTICLKGGLYLEWVDFFLSWEKQNYSNINRMILPAYTVWLPKVWLYNSAQSVNQETLGVWWSHVWVYANGRTIWYPKFTFLASCIFDFSDFPYDVQECPVIIGLVSYTSKEVEFFAVNDHPGVWLTFNDTKTVISGWELLGVRQRRGWWDAYNQTFRWDIPTDEEQAYYLMPVVEITPRLRRHLPYFQVTTVLPCVATSMLTALALLVQDFFRKVSILVVNVFMQILFCTELFRILPPTTDTIPNIVCYFAAHLILTLCAVGFCVALESFKYQHSKPSETSTGFMHFVGERWIAARTKLKICCNVNKLESHSKEEENEETPGGSKNPLKSKKMSRAAIVDAFYEILFFVFAFVYLIFMCNYI